MASYNRFQSLDQVGSQSPSELSNYMTGNAILGERGFVLDFIKMYVENFNIWYPYIQKDSNRNETEEGKLICTEPSEIQKTAEQPSLSFEKSALASLTLFFAAVSILSSTWRKWRESDSNNGIILFTRTSFFSCSEARWWYFGCTWGGCHPVLSLYCCKTSGDLL